MSIDYGFSTDEVELQFDSIPVGSYNVRIDGEEVMESQSGNKYMKVTYKIVEGECKGRLIVDNFNIWNSNEKSKIIAR